MSAKICIVRHGYFPDDPRIHKELNALKGDRYSVDVICLRRNGEKKRDFINGVNIYRLSHSHRRSSLIRYIFEYFLSFSKMLMLVTVLFFRKHYEVIQVNTLPDALVFITIIPHLLGAKVLLDMHEPTPELFITKYGSRKYSMILKLVIFLEQLAIRYADKVITVNSALCKRLIERGADKNRITVIRNLPDESVFRERSNPNKEQGLRLITHGSIEKRYGVDLIIRALPILHLNNKRWHITIVGDGREMENLQHLAEELDCLKHITFTGRVPFPQVVNLINSSDIGIISLPPSPFSELCQPNKLFEYVACKKPVVAPRLRAIEECFDDSCIMFFEPGDYRSLAKAIQILHRNPDMQKTLADNAYHRYEKIKWSKEKQIYLNLVRKLVSV